MPKKGKNIQKSTLSDETLNILIKNGEKLYKPRCATSLNGDLNAA